MSATACWRMVRTVHATCTRGVGHCREREAQKSTDTHLDVRDVESVDGNHERASKDGRSGQQRKTACALKAIAASGRSASKGKVGGT